VGLPNITVAPHAEPRLHGVTPVVPRVGSPRGSLRIAVVGAIGRVKGFEVLVRMVERAARDRMPFFLTVIGFTSDDEWLKRYKNAQVTGPYKHAELKEKLDAVDPDFVFLPSIWPETYSYVLSEVWEAGYPVVAFDIGAPAARIKAMGGGVVIPFTRDSRVVLDALMEARDRVAALEPMVPEATAIPSLDAYYAQPGAAGDAAAPRAMAQAASTAREIAQPAVHEVSRAKGGNLPLRDPEPAVVEITRDPDPALALVASADAASRKLGASANP